MMTRKKMEHYFIKLKADLRVASVCQKTKAAILTNLTNPAVFDDDFTSYFALNDKVTLPFKILLTDPPNIVTLKKIINTLEHLEKGVREMERIDISQDSSFIKVCYRVFSALPKLINEMYQGLQLLDDSTGDIHRIIGPQLNTLIPVLSAAAQGMQVFTPSGAGQVLGDAVSFLPSAESSLDNGLENLSYIITAIPRYFETLQKLISTDVVDEKTDTKAYAEIMKNRAERLKANFEGLSKNSGIWSLPSYFSTINQLVAHSSDLMNTAAPLTTAAYKRAVAQLDMIRHEMLPTLVAEAESLEERMGLKPTLLTKPLLTQMQKYYVQLATQVNQIAVAAGVIDDIGGKMNASWALWLLSDYKQTNTGSKLAPVPDLTNMLDDKFSAKVDEQRVSRLKQAEFSTEDNASSKNALVAAKNFFELLATRSSLANFYLAERKTLKSLYDQFQPYFVVLYPDIDRVIEVALASQVEAGYFGGALNAWYDTNSLQKVLDCEDSIINALEPNDELIAKSKFTVKMINKSAEERGELLYDLQGGKTHLQDHTREPLLRIQDVEDGKLLDYYQKNKMACGVQLHHLNTAKNSFNQFLKLLPEYNQDNPGEALSLTPTRKERLRKAYKDFQPYVKLLLSSDLNTRLIKILNTPGDALRSRDIEPFYRGLDQPTMSEFDHALEYAIKNTNVVLSKCADEEKKAQISGLTKAPEPRGVEKNMFTMLRELKLSTTIDDFTTSKLQPFLKENLDPDVINKLSFDRKNLPFISFYQDSSNVARYKKLINGLYYLQIGLAKLERMYSVKSVDGDTTDRVNLLIRGFYTRNIATPILIDLSYAGYFLVEAVKDASLMPIMNDVLQLMKPLKNIPHVADYLNTPFVQNLLEAGQDEDIFAAWEAQQKIVEEALSSPEVAQTVATRPPVIQAAVVAIPGDDVNLETMTKLLYQIPDRLRRLYPGHENDLNHLSDQDYNTKTAAFVEKLRGLSVGPGSFKNILAAFSEFNAHLSTTVVENRKLLLEQADNLRSRLGAELITVADNAEFHLGLKPGTLSDQVVEQSNDFYTALIGTLPLKQEQQKLTLLTSTVVTKRRLEQENTRFKTLSKDRRAEQLQLKLFGSDVIAVDEIYIDLETLGRKNRSLMDIKPQLVKLYERLIPFLDNKDAEHGFTADYLERINDEAGMHVAIDTLTNHKADFYKLGIFETLENLTANYLNINKKHGGYPAAETNKYRAGFLRAYDQLMPYLFEIDNPRAVFYSAFKIYALRDLRKGDPAEFPVRCAELINMKDKFAALVKAKEQTKEDQVQQCNRRIEHFEQQLMRENMLIKMQVEAFREKTVGNYLTADAKTRYQAELGSYADLFVDTISNRKDELIADLTFDVDIEASIAEGIGAIKASFVELLQAADLIRANVNSAPGNDPYSLEKRTALNQMLTTLDNFPLDQNVRLCNLAAFKEQLATNIVESKKVIRQIREYDAMIEIHNTIVQMKRYLAENPDQEKSDELRKLEKILAEPAKTPKARLDKLVDEGLSPACKTILAKSANIWFMKLLKSFWSLLTGWQSKEDRMVSSLFKHKLAQTLPPAPEPAPDNQEDVVPRGLN